jgi:hypothetical protein
LRPYCSTICTTTRLALADLEAQAVEVRAARGVDEPEVRRLGRLVDWRAVGQEQPDRGVAGRAEVAQVGPARRALADADVAHELHAVGEVVDGGRELVVEVRAHARGGHLADDDREGRQDDERQTG